MEFSDALTKRCKRYYKKKTGIELSDEETQEFLRSLAGLYKVFGEISQNNKKTKLLVYKSKS